MIRSELRKLFSNKSFFTKLSFFSDFSFALLRNVDSSIVQYGLKQQHDDGVQFVQQTPFNLSSAQSEHQSYVESLQRIGVSTVILPSDGFPDSVFIEDTAIVIGNTVLITNPGADSRKPEVNRVRNYFYELDGKYVVELTRGTLDGGDVLFTGSEIFVGLTNRTNREGIQSLAESFPNYQVHEIDLRTITSKDTRNIFNLNKHRFSHNITNNDATTNAPPLHLKSICSMCGPNHILIGGLYGLLIEQLFKAIEMKKSGIKYQYTFVPDEGAANCLYINSFLLRRPDYEFPNSCEILKSLPYSQIEVDNSELSKFDGALTCCSLLFN